MATDLGNDPASTLQTTNNPAPTTLSAGHIDDIILQDAVTAVASDVLTLEHGTSGTPGASADPTLAFGGRLNFKLDDTVNAKQLTAFLVWFWRAVGGAVGSDAGSISLFMQSGGTPREVMRINDFDIQFWPGDSTNPGISFLSAQTIGFCAAGGRMSAIHASVEVAGFSSAAGAPKVGFLSKAAAPVVQQPGGVLTAGAAYTANEQSMINKLYVAAQAFGFIA